VGWGRWPGVRTRPFFAGSSSSGSRRSHLLGHIEAEGSSQQRQPVSEVLHNIFTYFFVTFSLLSVLSRLQFASP
jgi:hypothetical protein